MIPYLLLTKQTKWGLCCNLAKEQYLVNTNLKYFWKEFYQFFSNFTEIHCIFNESQFIHGHVSGMPSPDRQNGPLRFYQVGDQITLNCNHPEAEMEGSNRITCTHGGTWDQEPPICHQLPCSKIPRYFEQKFREIALEKFQNNVSFAIFYLEKLRQINCQF